MGRLEQRELLVWMGQLVRLGPLAVLGQRGLPVAQVLLVARALLAPRGQQAPLAEPVQLAQPAQREVVHMKSPWQRALWVMRLHGWHPWWGPLGLLE